MRVAGYRAMSRPNPSALGAGRTLTLVDGRRHVGSQGGTLSVDVDTIPRLLIESVEIITGGASSVYGADAVSGVVNFILKQDFEGIDIRAQGGLTVSIDRAVDRTALKLALEVIGELGLWA